MNDTTNTIEIDADTQLDLNEEAARFLRAGKDQGKFYAAVMGRTPSRAKLAYAKAAKAAWATAERDLAAQQKNAWRAYF